MKRSLFLFLSIWISAGTLTAQNLPSSIAGTHSSETFVPVTLGQSVVALTGPWRFHIGDNPQWADPNFDDSAWQSYELMSRHSPLTPEEITQSAALPGWQQHGHPGYTGYAWYRLRLQLPEDVESPALMMPQHVDDAYEVYLNGVRIGSFGDLNGWPLSYQGQPQLFSIPSAMLRTGRPVALALRFWNQRNEAALSERNLAGGLRGVPVVGPSALLQVFEQSVQEKIGQRRIAPGETSSQPWELLGLAVLYIAVGLISFSLFFFSRGHKEYLWTGISLVGFGAMLALIAISVMPQTAIPAQLIFVTHIVTFPAAAFAMPLAAMYLLEVPRVRWHRANYFVAPINLLWSLQVQGWNLGWLPPTASTDFARAVTLWLGEVSLGCLLLAIAVDGVRTIGRKAWLPMTPGLLFALYCLSYDLAVSGIFQSWVFAQIICASVPLSVLVIFLLRFTEQQRENVRMADDMRQAQEVQHLLIPQHLPSFPGWLIESEYRPARQVGGDFFQILPGSDGSLLIVVGDVSGKGLKAAMTVSAIVGALRGCTARSPAQVLAYLNRALHGQVHGFFTCCAALITDDGSTTIANAGHLPPYRNGEELPVPNGLPLGVLVEAAYEERRYELASGDRVTFISDGVVEAQSAGGELFGFDRTRAISTQPAETIARTAQSFGQEDDITVLTVIRVPKLEAIPA
jgi:hypothetical protein